MKADGETHGGEEFGPTSDHESAGRVGLSRQRTPRAAGCMLWAFHKDCGCLQPASLLGQTWEGLSGLLTSAEGSKVESYRGDEFLVSKERGHFLSGRVLMRKVRPG